MLTSSYISSGISWYYLQGKADHFRQPSSFRSERRNIRISLLACENMYGRTLGPAEVAAWALLRYVWTILKNFGDGIADAAEVRCANYLGTNNAEMARLSAYKSIFLSIMLALVATSVLFLVGENLVMAITPDKTMQRLMFELLPMIGLAQLVMTMGVVAWALIGAQGRHKLATLVQFVGSWGVAIPLSALFSIGLHINLQGLITALILGIALSASGNMYILIRTQWDRAAILVSADCALKDDPPQRVIIAPQQQQKHPDESFVSPGSSRIDPSSSFESWNGVTRGSF